MTKDKAKAEAEKIKEEFYRAIPLKGFKGTYSTFMDHTTQCAIIQVKAQINLVNDIGLIYEIDLEYYVQKFQSILTELERK